MHRIELTDLERKKISELGKIKTPSLWQPIETAPKDGTFVDIFVPELGERYCDAYYVYTKKAWCWNMSDNQRIVFDATPPSHWMPSPEPPK